MSQGFTTANAISNVNAFVGDQPVLDAFGRLRTSHPTYVFDSQLTYDLAPLVYEQITAQSGATVTYDSTNRQALMTFSATPTGGAAYMQSFECFRYQPGRAHSIFMTFNLNGGVANVLKFAGYSDGTNGVELQLNGTQAQFVLYSGTGNGNQTVLQANWNQDKFDGSGASGLTLDLTKIQILVIDFQALYSGRVRIGFDINGVIYWAHWFNHANLITVPFFQSANLPIRCGMTCTGTVSATMRFTCASVSSGAGQEDPAGYSFTQEGTVTAGSGTRTHILSLRPKATFNSIANRAKFVLDYVNVIVTGTNPVYWELCVGQAISGTTTFSDVNSTYSAFEFNTAGTISGSPTVVIASGYAPPSSGPAVGSPVARQTGIRYPITLNQAGTVRALGTLTLIVTGLGGTSATRAAFNWHETR